MMRRTSNVDASPSESPSLLDERNFSAVLSSSSRGSESSRTTADDEEIVVGFSLGIGVRGEGLAGWNGRHDGE